MTTSAPRTVTVDGNEAAASVAHRINEVIAIFPITPSSPMGEWADQWSAEGKSNIWGSVPLVVEMQSEGGAAGAVHGALQTGSLTTTFTASQGLLLMIPNMYKIAGELTSTVFHVAARALAAQGLSIFGDHSDVMAARQTGWAMLASSSVQEVHDFAAIAAMATLEARVPFVHFFDGFRTSHEVAKISLLSDDDLRALIDRDLVLAHRARGLSPERPFMRGTAQNPDVYFQGREAGNTFYLACPGIVQDAMNRFAALTGRQYQSFEYFGAPDAEHVIVIMGSAAQTVVETVRHTGGRIGVVNVHLYRPFDTARFVAALPESVRRIAVLDRTKEPGSAGEPLYQDVVTAISEADRRIHVIGGRYGLGSKEFTPTMVKAVYDELEQPAPRRHFTVGISDDVTHTSLAYETILDVEDRRTVRAVFYGLGADGTVGANKNSIKIIGEDTDLFAQGYFVYDSKKSGSITVSHLRFGPMPINAPYLIGPDQATFIACHQFSFLDRLDVLELAAHKGTFLLNSPFGPDDVWQHLPRPVQADIIRKQLRLFVIDGDRVAREAGMAGRVNTVMQTAFFALSNILPRDQAIAAIKHAARKTYSKRGEAVVERNFRAIDAALDNLREVRVPASVTSTIQPRRAVPESAPEFVQTVTSAMLLGRGDALPVSALPVDGTYPTGTSRWEKRNIAAEIAVWDPETCIQCDKCVLVCPHAVIRAKVYPVGALAGSPESFKSAPARWKEFSDHRYSLQVSPEDCTGCALCVEACPVKSKTSAGVKAINMAAQPPLRDQESQNWDFFLSLPEPDRRVLNLSSIKDSQLLPPLFEFSGACAGCGETPYLKLISQLFGERALVANATGCSSIYGGNLPTTPWTHNAEGRGPAWSNSLFEDNAEYGMGFRLTIDQQLEHARTLLLDLKPLLGSERVANLLAADQPDESGIYDQRQRVAELKQLLTEIDDPGAANLLSIADVLVKRSVWIIGGDGWAYDIDYGGLDHVLASGRNVNVLVLDTEVYSNTGGQMSKATPRGAVARFAAGGKSTPKKDLGLLAMDYGSVYVARVAIGANDAQTLKAILEAEAYDGPSLILAYSHCIAHGYDLRNGLQQQKRAVLAGYWPLYRYDPRLPQPLQLDSKPPSIPLEEYAYAEGRYRMLQQTDPERAERLIQAAAEDVHARWARLEQLLSGQTGSKTA
jgi:pyruvate-ferredoxin/flavodoxin oxidoreductase